MAYDHLVCPECGTKVRSYRNPVPTVDIIIETMGGIVLIERVNEPHGWALPGGFVDYGETLEQAATREALEETGLAVGPLRLLGCYSDPSRDKRLHTISTVFVAAAEGTPVAGDDAKGVAIFRREELPAGLCFDHETILADYGTWKASRNAVRTRDEESAR
jgi:8-oxo-dGTP diphosphatase